jgi:hypothetical protein
MGMSRPSYGRPQSSFFGSGSMMQRPMPGGPGKGRPRGRFMRGGPGKGRGQGMPQSMLGMQQPMPARPSFGQVTTQGPMSMLPPQRPVDISQYQRPMNMGRPMPQPSGFDRGSFGQMGPPSNIQFQQAGNNRPAPEFMGRVGQAFTQGPTSMDTPLSQMRTHALPALPLNRGFYGGGITDLY